MITILIVIYIFSFEIFRKKEFKILDSLSFFNFAFILIYLLVPIFIYSDVRRIDALYSNYAIYPNDYRYFILVLTCYIFVVLSYFIFKKGNVLIKNTSSDSIYLSRFVYLWTFIIGLCLFLLFTQKIGFVTAISSGFRIRTGEVDLGTAGLFMRFEPVFSIIYTCLLYDFFVVKRKLIVPFILMTTVFILWTISLAGRGAMISPLIIVVIAYIIRKRKIVNFKYFFGSIILFFTVYLFIAYGKNVIYAFRSLIDMNYVNFIYLFNEYDSQKITQTTNLTYLLYKEMGHSYTTLNYLLNHSFDFLYFRDISDSILDLIPEKLVGLNMNLNDSISTINTRRFWPFLSAASYPPGFVGFAYNSYGFVGLILFSIVFGYFLGKLEKIMRSYRDKTELSYIIYSIVLFHLISYFTNGDFRNFMRSSIFPLIVFFVMIRLLSYKWHVGISKSISGN